MALDFPAPIRQIAHEEITMLIDWYLDRRDENLQQGRPHATFVVILRGLPGFGKSTFALLMKAYAQARRLSCRICCADDYFDRPEGYQWVAAELHRAHTQCFDRFRGALDGNYDVIIVDNTNIRRAEYQDYVRVADLGNHIAQFVTFSCPSPETAQLMRQRSIHRVPEAVVARRFEEFVIANTQMQGVWVEARDWFDPV